MKTATKTDQQLRKEWGDDRYASALGALLAWCIIKGVPQTVGQLEELKEYSSDAFEILVAKASERGFCVDGWDGGQDDGA